LLNTFKSQFVIALTVRALGKAYSKATCKYEMNKCLAKLKKLHYLVVMFQQKNFQHNFSGAFLLYYTAVFMSGSKSLLGMDFISKVHYFSSA